MKYIASADEFFGKTEDPRLTSLRESIMAVPVKIWENIGSLTLTQYSPQTSQESEAILNHQVELLDRFDTIEEANAAENLLIKYGYNPVFLTLEGAYISTLTSVKSINESVLGSIKDFVSMMTEGGSAIGILQFVLDIIGLVPGSWVGFPIDTVANLVNAAISFFRGNYLVGCISLVMCIPGIGQTIGGGLKLAIKPFAKIGEKLFGVIWKGGATRLAAAEFKAGALAIEAGAKASGGIIETLGKALKGIGEFIVNTGIKIIRSLVDFIGTVINKISFGLIPKPAGLIKWIDEASIKLTSFGKGATEAGEVLMKEEAAIVAGGEKAAIDSAAAARAAGETAIDADKIGTKFADIPGLNSEMQTKIITSPGFKKLVGASDDIQKMYIKGVMTEKLVGNILAKEGQIAGKSLGEILKDPAIVTALRASGSRLGDKAIANAIKAGDGPALTALFDEVIKNPKISGLISPNVAKTVAIFKEAPDLLIKGTQNLGKIQADLAKFTGKMAYRGISGRAFILFILKSFLRVSKCGKYLSSGNPEDTLDLVKSTALDAKSEISLNLAATNEMLANVLLETETTNTKEVDSTISDESLKKFKEANPDGYAELMAQNNKTKESITELTEKVKGSNPCIGDAAVAQAATGCVIKQPTIDTDKPQTKLITAEDWEKSGLNEHTSSILKQLGEDYNIKPQHPLSESNPLIKSYFADVYVTDGSTGQYSPNTASESRLDSTLDGLEKKGEIMASDKIRLKSQVLEYWNNGTVPAELSEQKPVVKELDEHFSNINFFKVGKLITLR